MAEPEKLIPYVDHEEIRRSLDLASDGQEFVVVRTASLETIFNLTHDLPAVIYQDSYIIEMLDKINDAIEASIDAGDGFVRGEEDYLGDEVKLDEEFKEASKKLNERLGKIALLAMKASLLERLFPEYQNSVKLRESVDSKIQKDHQLIETEARLTELAEKQAAEIEGLKKSIPENLDNLRRLNQLSELVAGLDSIVKDKLTAKPAEPVL